MKGYQMILLVNGILLLLLAVASLLYGRSLEAQSDDCARDTPSGASACRQLERIAQGSSQAAPVFFGIGVLLLVVAVITARWPRRGRSLEGER